jgi:adenine-specific DNA-methyltransferase
VALNLKSFEDDQLISLIGSKRVIAPQLKLIFSSLVGNKRNLKFLDVFSGTGAISRQIKALGHQVIANDNQYFLYLINHIYLSLNDNSLKSMFESFGGVDAYYSLINLHGMFAAYNKEGINEPYLSRYYAPNDVDNYDENKERLFFSPENGRFFDAVREEVESSFFEGRLTFDEKALVVASLLYKVSRKANISGTFTSYLKDLKNSRKRIRELAQLNVPILSDDALPKGSSYNLDALEFLKQHSADVIYLDPPSSVVQYSNNYHILNSVAKWDYYKPSNEVDENGNLKDRGGIREDWIETKSKFCSLKEADLAMVQLINNLDSRHVVLTYPTKGIVEAQRIKELLTNRYKKVELSVLHQKNQGGKQSNKGPQNLTQVFVATKTAHSYSVGEIDLSMLESFKKLDQLTNSIFRKGIEEGPLEFIGGVLLKTPLPIDLLTKYPIDTLNKWAKELEENSAKDGFEALEILAKSLKSTQITAQQRSRIEKKVVDVANHLLSEDESFIKKIVDICEKGEVNKRVVEQIKQLAYDKSRK